MIIHCAHCQGTMRVDEENLPDRPKVKVRCPHCQGIGYIEHKVAHPTPEVGIPAEKPVTKSFQSKLQPQERVTGGGEMEYDVSLPDDAFQDFRFPAEQERNGRLRNGATIGLKTIILIVASVVVVVFFALLVNIILPGPSGVKGVIRAVQPEEEQAPANSGRDSLPAPLRLKDRPNR